MRILGHIAGANVTFHGKGGTAECVTDFHFENRDKLRFVPVFEIKTLTFFKDCDNI